MKNRNSIRLSVSTPLQSLSAKAERAAAIAEVDRLNKKGAPASQPQKRKQRKQHTLPPIEMAARSIRAALAKVAGNGLTLYDEKPGYTSSAYAIYGLYNDADVQAHNLAKILKRTDPTVKVPKLTPVLRYVLFASEVDGTLPGSVTIYGKNAGAQYTKIRSLGYMLGMPVEKVNLEVGLSEYVDVKLRG